MRKLKPGLSSQSWKHPSSHFSKSKKSQFALLFKPPTFTPPMQRRHFAVSPSGRTFAAPEGSWSRSWILISPVENICLLRVLDSAEHTGLSGGAAGWIHLTSLVYFCEAPSQITPAVTNGTILGASGDLSSRPSWSDSLSGAWGFISACVGSLQVSSHGPNAGTFRTII